MVQPSEGVEDALERGFVMDIMSKDQSHDVTLVETGRDQSFHLPALYRAG